MQVIRGSLAALAVVAAVFAAGCGSSKSADTSTSSGSSTASSGGKSADLKAFEAKAAKTVSDAAAKQTTTPPTTGPKPVAGKSIFVIPCAAAAEGCAGPARAAAEAGKAIGWKTTQIDPAGDPSKQAAAIRQAIAAKADGIVIEAIDAQSITEPLKQAKAAGIKVVTFASVGPKELFDQDLPEVSAFEEEGYIMAASLYGATNGDMKLVMMTGTDSQVVNYRVAGTEKFVKECQAAGGKCEILVKKNYGIPEITTTAPQLAVDTVRQHPDLTALWVGYDAAALFMYKALAPAGLTKKGLAGAFDANAANLDLIRADGFQKFDLALAPEWIGYGQVDSLNRQFAGEKTVDEGLKVKLLNKSNLPAKGPWVGDTNSKAAFLKLWGKSGN